MMFKKIIILFGLIIVLIFYMLHTSTKNKLLELEKINPFDYDLGIKIITSRMPSSELTICCHGYGSNNSIVYAINSYNILSGSLISFNFPDKNLYGTPKEILPILYILKRSICDLKFESVNLYGFSAGGGAIINVFDALINDSYDIYLERLNILQKDKKLIMEILQKGNIILDCPLKSIEEIIKLRGPMKDLLILEKHYLENNMDPINVLNKLKDINLTIFINFENNDEILSNRDDKLFIDRLKKANKGKTVISISSGTGHCGFHKVLWGNYKNNKN